MEDNGSNEVDVLEGAETLSPRDVPQPYCFVHGRWQDEVILHTQTYLGLTTQTWLSKDKNNLWTEMKHF